MNANILASYAEVEELASCKLGLEGIVSKPKGLRGEEANMQGIEPDDPEMSFRRGYEHGAIETFHAIERFLDPAAREVLRAWIEKDVYIWRMKAMLG